MEEHARADTIHDRFDGAALAGGVAPLEDDDRWDDYTKARDEMFAATDTSWAPWYVAISEDKQRVRLNVITHLLKHIRYKAIKAPKVKLPERKIGRYKAIDYPFKYVPEEF